VPWLVRLVRATHPEPTVAVTAFVLAAGLSAGLGVRAVLLAAAVLAGQVSVGWSNDYIDRDRDRRAGRLGKPLASGALPAPLVARCAGGALVACTGLSLAVGLRPAAGHLVAVAAAWQYNAGLKGTRWSFVPYLVSFGLVPVVVVTLALPGHPAPRLPIVAAAALLGVAAHFANTVPDEEFDRRTGVRGLPQRLGARRSVLVAAALVFAATGLLLVGTGPKLAAYGPAAAALAATVAGVVAVLRLGRSAVAFRTVLVAVGLLVVGVVLSGPRLVS
jgi:4-hydroxybenzoate polyprenyltransferase